MSKEKPKKIIENLFSKQVRNDSSRFGPENLYGNFPGATLAWNISREDFMAGTRDWLDMLKLSLGWGLSGNDRIGNYNVFTTFGTHQIYSTYDIGGTNKSSIIGFQPSSYGNPLVTWETTETVNIGMDFIGFDNNRVNFSIDTWRRYTSDMLYRLSRPEVRGIATTPYINIGEMKTRGFDIELGYNNVAI